MMHSETEYAAPTAPKPLPCLTALDQPSFIAFLYEISLPSSVRPNGVS